MKYLMPLVCTCAVLAAATVHSATQDVESFAACKSMFPGGVAPTPQSKTVQDLCKQVGGQVLFAVRFDTTRKTPNWTAHSLTPEHLAQIKANAGKMTRPKFTPDADIAAADQAVDKSYVRSGYARGHVVPANDMSWSKAAYGATFHFSNVVPQKQAFNAGTWLGEEDAFRTYVEVKNRPMWIFSGVYGTNEDDPATPDEIEGPTIGTSPNTPRVPKCFYKIIVAPADQPSAQNGRYKVLATLFAWNDYGKRKTWINALTTLQVIETRTGIDFLSGLPLELSHDADFWGVEMPDTPSDCR